ncbi:MAG TPA: hypothetical protein VHX61_01045 [Rhizomicrobium sp.]|jgi:hypothetical protein|nr:hypothetical protein [Rhizomicrobium sp.]
MPFDGIDFTQRDLMLNKLDRVVHLLERQEKWCQHQILGWDGSRCILGALFIAGAKRLLSPVILAAARDITDVPFSRIDYFNDHYATDHELVMAVLSRAYDRILTGNIPPPPKRAAFVTWIFRHFSPSAS